MHGTASFGLYRIAPLMYTQHLVVNSTRTNETFQGLVCPPTSESCHLLEQSGIVQKWTWGQATLHQASITTSVPARMSPGVVSDEEQLVRLCVLIFMALHRDEIKPTTSNWY